MNEKVIKKELYSFYLKTGISYEGWVDFGNGKRGYAFNKVEMVNVPYNEYNHHYFAIVNTPVCIMNGENALPKNDEYYLVKSGDTLSIIAARYKVSVSALANWNGITNLNKIEVGQKLVIRKVQKVKPVANQTISMDYINTLIGVAGTILSAKAGIRYTERLWGGGFFKTAKGKLYDLSVLEKQANSKFMQGVEGLRIGANTAKNATKIFRGLGTTASVVSALYSGYEFANNPTLRNGFNVVGGIAGIACWELGFVYFYIDVAIDYGDVVRQNTQTQLDVIEGNGQFKDLSPASKLGWLMMFSGGSPTGPTGGY